MIDDAATDMLSRWHQRLTASGLAQNTGDSSRLYPCVVSGVVLLTTPTLDTAAAQGLGAELARLGYRHPETLTITCEVWSEVLLSTMTDTEKLNFYPRLMGLLNAMTVGWHNAIREVILAEQEAIHFAIAAERRQTQREIQALYRATSMLFSSRTLEEAAQQIAEAIVGEFHYSDCGVMLFDPEQRQMRRLARAGIFGIQPNDTLRVDGPGLVPKAVRTRQLVYVPDVTGNPDYIVGDPRTLSELVLPLQIGDQLIGALDLQCAQHDGFNERDRAVLTAFAERAAVALRNVQLEAELRQQTADLERRVEERTAQLTRAKRQVETILHDSGDAIVVAHTYGKIRQANPAFMALFGYMPDEITSLNLSMISPEDEQQRLMDAAKQVAATRTKQRLEVVVRRQDGEAFTADVILAPMIEVPDDPTRMVICNFRDMSEQKDLESSLRHDLEKEKTINELKSQFSAIMSHEFRTPLTVILSSSEMLRQYNSRMTDERKAELFDRIVQQINHLIDLLDDILMLSKARTADLNYQLEPFNLPAFCADLIDDLPAEQAARLVFVWRDPEIAIDGDDKLLRIALINLLTNALKYSPPTEPVTLTFEQREDVVRLHISDLGIGIPAEDHERLFREFHRARNVSNIEGTGLGLVIVQQIIDLHNGTVTFESALNDHTTFTITLPASAQ